MKEKFFADVTDAVLAIAAKEGVTVSEIVASLRLLADVALAGSGADSAAMRRTDAEYDVMRGELVRKARAIFRRRGIDLPPAPEEAVS